MTKTLYDVLEVSPSASRETIDAAYRSLIARYHPDKVAGLGSDLQALANQRAQELNEAYAILRDEGKRALYDRELRGELETQADPQVPVDHPKPDEARNVKLANWPIALWERTNLGIFTFLLAAVAFIVGGLILDILGHFQLSLWISILSLLPGLLRFGAILLFCSSVLYVCSGVVLAVQEAGTIARLVVAVLRIVVALLLIPQIIDRVFALIIIVPMIDPHKSSSLNPAISVGIGMLILCAGLAIMAFPKLVHKWAGSEYPDVSPWNWRTWRSEF